MSRDFIDYHCHILPALDDGAVDLEEALEMARALHSFGFSRVFCTPHLIAGYYDTTPEMARSATASLQRALHREGIALELVASTEHYLEPSLPQQLDRGYGIAPDQVILVESPFRQDGDTFWELVQELLVRKLKPLVAHPERCRVFFNSGWREKVGEALQRVLGLRLHSAEDPFISTLAAAGCRFQGNLGSFAGVYGSEIQQRAVRLLSAGTYSCLGSDAHRSADLREVLSAGFRTVAATVGEEETLRLLRQQLG